MFTTPPIQHDCELGGPCGLEECRKKCQGPSFREYLDPRQNNPLGRGLNFFTSIGPRLTEEQREMLSRLLSLTVGVEEALEKMGKKGKET